VKSLDVKSPDRPDALKKLFWYLYDECTEYETMEGTGHKKRLIYIHMAVDFANKNKLPELCDECCKTCLYEFAGFLVPEYIFDIIRDVKYVNYGRSLRKSSKKFTKKCLKMLRKQQWVALMQEIKSDANALLSVDTMCKILASACIHSPEDIDPDRVLQFVRDSFIKGADDRLAQLVLLACKISIAYRKPIDSIYLLSICVTGCIARNLNYIDKLYVHVLRIRRNQECYDTVIYTDDIPAVQSLILINYFTGESRCLRKIYRMLVCCGKKTREETYFMHTISRIIYLPGGDGFLEASQDFHDNASLQTAAIK